ncbi:unnamed protein product, partial [Ceratitis capitata]
CALILAMIANVIAHTLALTYANVKIFGDCESSGHFNASVGCCKAVRLLVCNAACHIEHAPTHCSNIAGWHS